MKKSKRLLGVLLAVIMMLALFVPAASAATTSTKLTATITNVASSGKIKLSWNAVKNAKNYAIYRATSKNGTYSKISTTTKLEFTNTSVTVGKTYYYQVKALSSSGKVLSTSSKVYKMVDCARPVVKAANKSDTGKITVSWEKITGATKYEVYRATSKTGTFSKILTTTKLTCTNTSAKAGSTYYYKVKAIASNSSANSAYSTVVSRTCDCAAPVVTVSNDQVTGKVVLKWKAIDGAAKYDVYRATSKTGTSSKVATVTALTYTDSAAKAGSTYYYKVMAVAKSSAANSSYSAVKNRTCDCPMIQDILVDYNDAGNIIFSWSKVDGATGYKISRAATENGTYTVITGDKPITKTTFTDTTAKVGSTYFYKLVAVNSKSSAADSAPVEGPALPLYPKVGNLKDASTDKKNVITWNKVSGVDGYVILRGETQDLDQMEPLAGVIQPLIKNTVKFEDDGRIHGVYYSIIGVKDMGADNDPIPSVPAFIYVK